MPDNAQILVARSLPRSSFIISLNASNAVKLPELEWPVYGEVGFETVSKSKHYGAFQIDWPAWLAEIESYSRGKGSVQLLPN